MSIEAAAWKTLGVKFVYSSHSLCRRVRDLWETTPRKKKELVSAIFLLHPPALTQRYLKEPTQQQFLLSNLLITCPATAFSWRYTHSSQASSPGPLPWQTWANIAILHTLTLDFPADLPMPVCSWPETLQSNFTSLAVCKQPQRRPAPQQMDSCPWERRR